jgi:ankyrin repeat protein
VTSISLIPVLCICFQAGITPFHNAAGNGHVDVMKYLVELGAKYDEKSKVSCYMHPCVVCVLKNMVVRFCFLTMLYFC